MDSTRLIWSLYNNKTERQIDGLTFIQVQGFMDSLSDEQREEWSAWHEGLDAWKPVPAFAEFAPSPMPKGRPVPPRPPSPRATTVKPDEKNTPQFDFDNEGTRAQISLDQRKYSDRRSNRRFLQAYKVQIFTQGTAFLTETVDISMGGMNLANPLPEGTPNSFSAKLTHQSGASVTIQCLKIPGINGQPSSRIRFNMDSNVESVLRTWLFNAQNE